VLLGRSPAAITRWASIQLPDNFRVGRQGNLVLMPAQNPGTALQAQIHDSKVALLTIRSHARSTLEIRPLSQDAVRRFLTDATSCSQYRLCQAHQNLDEMIFTGQTACQNVRVPLRLVSLRHDRGVIGVTVWLPRLIGPDSDG
jgi:hypothetical protein